MISINLQTAFFLYLFVWFATLTFFWGRELWRDEIYDWALSEGRVCICEECHFAFLIKPGESVSRCPRCDEMCTIRKRY